ncbi:MAG: dihydroorotate dehydrogenase-like protein, partial [Deltaproteobacteria bacterium]|nr:dihydroorotate dehydrogenase-like protein [Deltaproteobacteria bacterium]
ASSVQMTSVLLQHGHEHMAKIHRELQARMEEHEYESIRQMHGSMSRKHCPDPDAYERANYMRTLQSWRPTAR